MLTAITREVSPGINDCELSFQERQPIDLQRATMQHQDYRRILEELGARVIILPAQPDLTDSGFVEDPAIVLDEVAIILRSGAVSRRDEATTLATALSQYRRLEFITEPGTVDGGDVMRIDKRLFVGASKRTNSEGIKQLSDLVGRYGYKVQPVDVRGCLHFKSACSYVGRSTALTNRRWFDDKQLDGLEMIDVADDEPHAANALFLNDEVILPAAFPRTRQLLEQRGFKVRPVDVSELQKAEAGVTCMSLIFEAQ